MRGLNQNNKKSPMSIQSHIRPLALTLLLTSPVLDAAEPARKQLDLVIDPRQYAYGELMYSYYQGQYFQSTNQILMYKASGLFDDRNAAIDLLLGDLYTALKMPEQAEAVFSRLEKNQNVLSSTRNEVWLRKARLHYREGQHEKAIAILSAPPANLNRDIDVERRLMLANMLMTAGQFDRAQVELAPVQTESVLALYARFNLGVALLRSGKAETGLPLLRRVVQNAMGDQERLAIRDRAALAMAFHHLQNNQSDQAREILGAIRLDGPYSNQALLALGYAHYAKGDFKRSLVPWLELMQRNPADPVVQEAMLLAPRSYEELRAHQQAAVGYRFAGDKLRQQLKTLEKVAVQIQGNDWLDQLSGEATLSVGNDPMADVAMITPAANAETAFLFRLFATHTFTEHYRQYLQLRRLAGHLDQRIRDADALQQQADRITVLATKAAATKQRLPELAKLTADFAARQDDIHKRAVNVIDSTDLEQLADAATLERLRKLNAMEEQALRMGNTPADQQVRERVRRNKGSLLWDIAQNIPQTRERIFRDIAESGALLDMTRSKLNATEAAVQDIERLAASNPGQKARQLASRLREKRVELDGAMTTERKVLTSLAVKVLNQEREQLNTQLADAYLATARLQDAGTATKAAADDRPAEGK